MDITYTDLADDDDAEPDWRNRIYEVFNPDNSVGVACNRDGEVIGLHIADDVLDNGDDWLADEIVRLARLAHMKSRVGLRAEIEHKGGGSHTVDSFDLPTESAYRSLENAEFGTSDM